MGIFSKQPYYSNLAFLRNDFHAHLIPEIDDGARSLSESVEIISELNRLGLDQMVATPHIHPPHFDNTSDDIKRKAEDLNERLAALDLKVKVDFAAEYFADEHFMNLIQSKDLLAINNRYVLFETSTLQQTYNLFDIIFEIQTAGYVPILAHPERYLYFTKEMDVFNKMKEAGCHFQVNILSYTQYYGRNVKNLLNNLLKMELVDYLCTDVHHASQLPLIRNAMKKLRKYPFRNLEIYQ